MWLLYTHLLMVCGIAAANKRPMFIFIIYSVITYLVTVVVTHLSHYANIVYRLVSPRYIKRQAQVPIM